MGFNSAFKGLKLLKYLTLNLLTTTIVAPPSNDSKWQMGFNSAFKGLNSFKCQGFSLIWRIVGFLKIICCYTLSPYIAVLPPEDFLFCRFRHIITACKNGPFTKPRVVYVKMTCFGKRCFSFPLFLLLLYVKTFVR